MRTPCIVITRDRLSYAKLCLASLERFSDQLDIHIVDHGSTYPPMLDWLADTPHTVHIRSGHPPRALWEWPGLRSIVGESRPYLVTDPDIVLDDACPSDWLDQLRYELTFEVRKAGLGLRIDDLPDTPLAAKVRDWEAPFWMSRTGNGLHWWAPVDTTLALYPPISVRTTFELTPATRLDAPYLLRHLPWYGDLDPVETQYYREHALPGTSHWINGGW